MCMLKMEIQSFVLPLDNLLHFVKFRLHFLFVMSYIFTVMLRRYIYFVCGIFQLSSLPPVKAALDSLQANGATFSVFDDVSIEPTNIR